MSVDFERRGRCGVITINRPEARNAVNAGVAAGIEERVDRIEADDDLWVGIITGAMWAKEAWGAYWQWDPKETAALASWIVYALYMHLHTRNGWRGIRCAWINVIGFASIVFCYLGVNIWISGLHSYKV